MNDPRDKGFNYGTGWGSDPKPPLYLTALRECRKMTDRAVALSNAAWHLEMKIRDVRIATTGAEKAAALVELKTTMDRLHEGDRPMSLPPASLWGDA